MAYAMPLHGAEHAAIYITDYLAALLVLVFVPCRAGQSAGAPRSGPTPRVSAPAATAGGIERPS